MSMHGWGMVRSLTRDGSVKDYRLRPGTIRRVLGYGRPYRSDIVVLLLMVLLDAGVTVAVPLLLGDIIDHGVSARNSTVVVVLALIVAVLAFADGILSVLQRWYSARVGEGLIYDLRTQVFGHVLRQPVSFFTRTQTGALVSRLNTDVIGAQNAFTSTLQSVFSNAVTLVFILVAMTIKSWLLTLAALILVPLFLIPARLMGRRLAGLTYEQMNVNAELGHRMTERFNVAGALLVKLFGQPQREGVEYADRAGRVRDLGVKLAMNRAYFLVGLTVLASVATALVYGLGGVMAVHSSLTVGALVAMSALLARLYAPLTALSNVRVDVMTGLVSFERLFEVLDLVPLVADVDNPVDLPAHPLSVDFESVSFGYPSADQVSLPTLEQLGGGDRLGGGEVLHDITFHVDAGELVAVVGPTGAGKTTLAGLVARLHDPTSGTVRLDGVDLRTARLGSIHDVVGVVTQDAHLFHDTIRSNLDYARPGASQEAMWDALRAAQIADLIDSLPQGLDTVVGDRGHRLSGGEKQRLAIARLLLKGPGLVVLDEATAHLDSESEVAVQRALDTALSGRTALVIAHRLSTVRGADKILVVDQGRVVAKGTHTELLAQGGLYADLYLTQFADDTTSPSPA